uniref:Lateral signaling target protein 2 homolog n=1 Tax=Strigamia maritima TaxID=126957 RepID=T1J100_STRMM
MYSIRRWLYKPKKDDNSILAQFFYADEDLNYVAAELDSFDGRKDPERCTQLVNQLRQCQDKVLNICNQIMEDIISDQRANRDFRVKFPDDVIQENLAGQLWFGAECLAAGSSIMNREVESASMRPLAKALTKTLDNLRTLLREQCLKNPSCYSDKIKDSLKVFDRLFAEFELCYVSAMVPVKTMHEYDMQQDVIVVFSETLHRALQIGLISQEMVDDYDPALMFTIPRLAIVCGLLVYPEGPFNVDGDPNDLSEMYRPFQNLLTKIRELLWTLNKAELYLLEKTLCSVEDPNALKKSSNSEKENVTSLEETNENAYTSLLPNIENYVEKVCTDYPSCKQFIQEFYDYNFPSTCETTSVSPAEDEAADVADDEDEDDDDDDEATEVMVDSESGDDLTALQESLSDALTKVIDRSDTHDSGLHSDTCSTSSSEHISGADTTSNESNALREEATNVVSTLLDELVIKTICNEHQKRSPKMLSKTNLGLAKEPEKNYSSPGRSPNPKRLRGFSETCSSSPRRRSWVNIGQIRPIKVTCLRDSVECSSSCSSCQSIASSDWDSESCSSDTSSYNSDCQDDEEIALAIQAAEIATRNKLRGRFCSTEDLIHRLFVCISGVADQLQTNYASDLRNILKFVFQINCSESSSSVTPETSNRTIDNSHPNDGRSSRAERISVDSAEEVNERYCFSNAAEEPPIWIPDELASHCMSCQSAFTVVRRRHHCRNCGKVFCSRCSSNSVPLPQYGHDKPVRVCNRCFIFQVTPFFIHGDALY